VSRKDRRVACTGVRAPDAEAPTVRRTRTSVAAGWTCQLPLILAGVASSTTSPTPGRTVTTPVAGRDQIVPLVLAKTA
jgi:hypothetical protein